MPAMSAQPDSLTPSAPTQAPQGPALGWVALPLLLALAPLMWWAFGPSGVTVTVMAKTWQRDIEIEKRIDDAGSAWCDELPADAHQIQRLLARDIRRDDGAQAERCHYLAPQWRVRYSARAEGAHPQAPAWPQTDLNTAPASADSGEPPLGSERQGKRHEHYALQLSSATGQQWSCKLAQREWQAVPLGAQFRIKVDRYGVADCAGVSAAQH